MTPDQEQAFLRGVELGKRLYDRERRPQDPSCEDATHRIRSVYIACATKHAHLKEVDGVAGDEPQDESDR